MAKHGGARQGAGRKPGSTNKPKITDHLTQEEMLAIVEATKAKALEGDTSAQKLLIEQYYGKAIQTLAGDRENPLFPEEVHIKTADDAISLYLNEGSKE